MQVAYRYFYLLGSIVVGRQGDLLGGFSPEAEINDVYGDAIRWPTDCVVVNDYTVMVLWHGEGPNIPLLSSGIFGHRMSASGRLPESDISFADTVLEGDRQIGPKGSTSPYDSTLWISWLDDTPGRKRIRYGHYRTDGTKLDTVRTAADLSGFESLWSPDIVCTPDGRVLMVWSGKRAGVWGIYLLIVDSAGIPTGDAIEVPSSGAATYSETEITANPTGGFALVWEEAVSGRNRIAGLTIPPSADLSTGTRFLVFGESDTSNQTYPAVTPFGDRIWVSCKKDDSHVLACVILRPNSTDGDAGSMLAGNKEGIPICSLFGAYPNPFNASSVIQYHLTRAADVRVFVIDLLGKEVARLREGRAEAGYHEVRFDASGLSSGVYFYRLTAGSFVQTRKLLLVR